VAFLRIPPFPGSRAGPLARAGFSKVDPAALVAALRTSRVGGSFWGAQLALPAQSDLLLVPDSEAQLAEMASALAEQQALVIAPPHWRLPPGVSRIAAFFDPWWLVEKIGTVCAGAGQELGLIAALAGRRVVQFGTGDYSGCADDPAGVAANTVSPWQYVSPFTGAEITPLEAVAQLAEWRTLIDANRLAGAVLGVARWKQVTMDALLWDGSDPVRHDRHVAAGQTALAWKSRVAPQLLKQLELSDVTIGEIEDGMIRSTGLGANCVPPLSVIVDFEGVHFDPSKPSGLERILAEADMPPLLLDRASALRKRLVAEGISKYGRDAGGSAPQASQKRRVLVPGQVEDDRSVMTGGAGLGNLELLRRAREREPDAQITFKPHPDVEAGHRKGRIPDNEVLKHADAIERQCSIIAAIDDADCLHVLTSLAGFEALMRGKDVTCHGVPFYAGWGLTRDLAEVPPGRGRQRSLDELVAAVLILYPRYLDPITRLPCPVEVLVDRMATGQAKVTSPLVRLRQLQGSLNRLLSRVGLSR
jgi:capsular polysaccharide export protein